MHGGRARGVSPQCFQSHNVEGLLSRLLAKDDILKSHQSLIFKDSGLRRTEYIIKVSYTCERCPVILIPFPKMSETAH